MAQNQGQNLYMGHSPTNQGQNTLGVYNAEDIEAGQALVLVQAENARLVVENQALTKNE